MIEPDSGTPTPRRPSLHKRWFAEMKRRKVCRVIAAYGAGSFVALEVADVVFPAIPLPEAAISVLLWVLVACFPVAVLLAWAFEISPDGVRLTEAAAPGEIESIATAPAAKRWPAGLMALAGLLLLGLSFYGGRRSAELGEPDPEMSADSDTSAPGAEYVDPSEDPRPAIAVLPFADMSQAGDQEYFSDGISEEILQVLSRIPDLRVAARSAAFRYRGSGLDLTQVGEELQVPYLLAGSVRRDGDQLRISAELVSTSNGFRLWSETYDRRLESVFVIQTEIAEAITDALRIPLGLSQEALVSPTLDMDAHDLYLSARAAMRRRGSGVNEAVGLFEEAVSRDSVWAPAWAGLAEALAIYPLYAEPTGESSDSLVWAQSLSQAESAARRALELDPRSAAARVALGGVHRDRWEWGEAEREYLRAIELDPDSEEAHTQYAELLWGMGRLDEALAETRRAMALDRAPIRLDAYGFALYMNGRNREAEAMLEEGLAMDPGGEVHYLRTVLSHLLLMEGRYREAVDRFAPFLPDPAGHRLMGEALESGDASALPESTIRGLPETLARLGEYDRALDVLEEQVFALPFRVQYQIWDPNLAPIWETRRFREVILPRVRLEGVEPRYAPAP
jgi:TolB-like protein